MADEKNEQVTPLTDEAVENAAGGWAGSDKYTEREYRLAGIIWVHHVIGADRYFYDKEARDVTQEEAERITDEWFKAQGINT